MSRSPATLASLRPPQKAEIVALSADGTTRRRLLDLGLVPGTQVQAVLQATSGQLNEASRILPGSSIDPSADGIGSPCGSNFGLSR